MNKKSKLVSNTIILAIGTLFTKVLAFLFLPLYSKWLSVEEYGLFDLYSTYITLLIPVLTLACGEAVFRFLIDASENDTKKSIVSTGFMITFVGASIGVLVIALASSLSRQIKSAFLLYMVSEIAYNYFLSYSRGEKRLKVYAIAGIVMMLSSSIFVTFFVFVLQMGLFGILLGYAIAYFISCFYAIVASGFLKFFSLKAVNKAELKRLLFYSAPLIPNTLSWWVMNVSDRSIIQWVLGTSLLGVYAIACKIPSLCSTLFSVFQYSWLQSVSETILDDDRDIFYSQVFNKLVTVTASICIGILSVNFLMFDYVFDAKYAAGYWHIGLLIPAVLLATMASYLGGIFIGQKDTKRNGATTIITAVINIVSHIVLIQFVGIYAASLSTLVSYLALVLIRWGMIRTQVRIMISNKTKIIMVIMIYYSIIQYCRFRLLEITNLVIACVLFMVINGDIILGTISKAKKMIKRE